MRQEYASAPARQSPVRAAFFYSPPLVIRMVDAGSRTAPAMMRWRDQTGSMRAAPAGEGTRARGGKGKDRRPVIGVLFDSVRGTYQTTLLAGLADAASRREVSLAVFAGGVMGAPAPRGCTATSCSTSATPTASTGPSSWAARSATRSDRRCWTRSARGWRRCRMASLALGPPNVPCLTLDEEPGMRQGLDHLLMRHGCRRIAFIRGPSVNAEAERRYAIYRAVLTEQGLPIDPALICQGNFEKSSGEAAVELLVDERRVPFDALVACNDYMALGAMEALDERGLQVPSDVAVIGFDDIEEARFSTPPLTTIRQPLYQQGEAALDLVLAQLEGRQVALRASAPTELVVRQSCGCFSGPGPPGPRRSGHHDRDAGRQPAGRARRGSRSGRLPAPCTAPTPRSPRAGIASCSTPSRPSCGAPAQVSSPPRSIACWPPSSARGRRLGLAAG